SGRGPPARCSCTTAKTAGCATAGASLAPAGWRARTRGGGPSSPFWAAGRRPPRGRFTAARSSTSRDPKGSALPRRGGDSLSPVVPAAPPAPRSLLSRIVPKLSQANDLFQEQWHRIIAATDRAFAVVLGLEWLVGIALAVVVSPLAWA